MSFFFSSIWILDPITRPEYIVLQFCAIFESSQEKHKNKSLFVAREIYHIFFLFSFLTHAWPRKMPFAYFIQPKSPCCESECSSILEISYFVCNAFLSIYPVTLKTIRLCEG